MKQIKPESNDTTNNYSYLQQTESESEVEVFNMNSFSKNDSIIEHNSSGHLMQSIKRQLGLSNETTQCQPFTLVNTQSNQNVRSFSIFDHASPIELEQMGDQPINTATSSSPDSVELIKPVVSNCGVERRISLVEFLTPALGQ